MVEISHITCSNLDALSYVLYRSALDGRYFKRFYAGETNVSYKLSTR